jgi:hypothetical protein
VIKNHALAFLPQILQQVDLVVQSVRTPTRDRVPPTSSAISRTRRRRRLAGARYVGQAASSFKDPKPHTPGENPSGRTAVMGCPRSVRPPLGLCRSKLSCMRTLNEKQKLRQEWFIDWFFDYVWLFNRPSPLTYLYYLYYGAEA